MSEQPDDAMHQALVAWGAAERAATGALPALDSRPGLTRPAGARTWPAAVAAAAAVVAVAVSATLLTRSAGTGDAQLGVPAVGTPTVTTSTGPAVPVQLPSDELLTLTPSTARTAELSRAQAERVMLNSWPPPPLEDDSQNEVGPPHHSPVQVGLAQVRLDPTVNRLGRPLPVELPLAWVATWTTREGPQRCPSGPYGGYTQEEATVRLHAYVLAADGSVAYYYDGPSKSCTTRRNAPDSSEAKAQQAVNRISVPWSGTTRDASGDVLMTFRRPVCAGVGGITNDSNETLIYVEVPVGASCPQTVQDSIRTGPVEPKHHPLLGPIRTRLRDGGMEPALPG